MLACQSVAVRPAVEQASLDLNRSPDQTGQRVRAQGPYSQDWPRHVRVRTRHGRDGFGQLTNPSPTAA